MNTGGRPRILSKRAMSRRIQLEPRHVLKLSRLSARTGKSQAQLIRDLIEAAELEDYSRAH